MTYNFCGNSGLQLPQISLGLWHNFGDTDDFFIAAEMICHAFDSGITHFDLANNYGPPPGSAEVNFGKILSSELKNHRDEIVISSKAGHFMWNGPYGDGGSRKSLMASINQSLKRTGLEYFDIFYSHRYDSQTPLEETVQALIDMVRQGKTLYVGLSKYPAEQAQKAFQLMKAQNVPCLIYQDRYNIFNRLPEKEHFALNEKNGVGFIAFSPLAQGLLTNKYLYEIPEKSRAARNEFLKKEQITSELINKISRLNDLAESRGQTLAQMSLAWILNHKEVTSVIIGTSSVTQLNDNLEACRNLSFTDEELQIINNI